MLRTAGDERRLDDLREEIEEGRRWGDPDRKGRAQEEIDAIAQELSRAVGLGGRVRRAGSATERARVNATRNIRAALRKIDAEHPEFARLLAAGLRTGTFCAFAPDPDRPIRWRL